MRPSNIAPLLALVVTTAGVTAEVEPSIAHLLDSYLTTSEQVLTNHLSTLHWNTQVSIFISRDADRYRKNVVRGQAERAGETVDAFVPYEPGTVLIKEHRREANGTIVGWAMMIRQATAQPLGGPWRYVEVDADRHVILDGKGVDPLVFARCAACHNQIGARDFLFHSFADAVDTAKQPSAP